MWLAAVRAVLAIVAIPLAPFLYKEHFLVLVLLRPTKEVLLAGGYLAAKGDVHLLQIAGAAIPLAILAVWHSFALGRLHHTEIKNGDLPWLANTILKPDKVRRVQKVLRRRGSSLVFLGRLAAFPSTVIGLAAGASKMQTRTFLAVDAAGGFLALSGVLALGYVAHGASSRAQIIALIGGVVALLAFSLLLSWFMHQEPKGGTAKANHTAKRGTTKSNAKTAKRGTAKRGTAKPKRRATAKARTR